jgi:hypothetical protein
MPFHTPPSRPVRGSSADYEDKNGPSPHTSSLSDKLQIAPTLDKATWGRLVLRNKQAKRARSLSFSDTVTVFDSSDDGINEPVTPPPNNRPLISSCEARKRKPQAISEGL